MTLKTTEEGLVYQLASSIVDFLMEGFEKEYWLHCRLKAILISPLLNYIVNNGMQPFLEAVDLAPKIAENKVEFLPENDYIDLAKAVKEAKKIIKTHL